MTLSEEVVMGIDMINWTDPSPNVGEKPAPPGTGSTGLSLQQQMEKDIETSKAKKAAEETATPAAEETATPVVEEAGQPAEETTA